MNVSFGRIDGHQSRIHRHDHWLAGGGGAAADEIWARYHASRV
jgi:hypothetical protein